MTGKYPPQRRKGLSRYAVAFLSTIVGAISIGFYILWSMLLCIPALIILPLRFVSKSGRSFSDRVAHAIADLGWGLLIRHLEVFGGWNHVYSGDEIPKNETVFVVANHRYWLDFATIMGFAARKNRLGCLKMFVKKALSYIPGFGWGMYATNMVPLSRDWASDSARVKKTFSNLKESTEPFWLTSHLEGTRFSAKKQALSHEFAKKSNRASLQFCLLPRTKGFVATVEGLRSRLDAVYDVTLVYDHHPTRTPDAASAILSKWIARPIDVHIHVRRFPIKDLPTDPRELEEWIHKVWEEKDRLLTHFFKHDEFPNTRDEPFRHELFSCIYY